MTAGQPDRFADCNEPIKHTKLGKPRRGTMAAPKSPAMEFRELEAALENEFNSDSGGYSD
jgi:hypothetical protein